MWPIMLLLLGAAITVGAFYYLSLGMPHQLFLIRLQAISVGAGVLVTAIIALTLRGEEQNEKRPLWPMLLPLICGIFAMGIYYALMIGSPQVIDMLVLQGYSVGAGTLLIILISIPIWRGMRPVISLAGVPGEQDFSVDEVARHERLGEGYQETGHGMTTLLPLLTSEILPGNKVLVVESDRDLTVDKRSSDLPEKDAQDENHTPDTGIEPLESMASDASIKEVAFEQVTQPQQVFIERSEGHGTHESDNLSDMAVVAQEERVQEDSVSQDEQQDLVQKGPIIVGEFRGTGEANEAVRACIRGRNSMATEHFSTQKESEAGQIKKQIELGDISALILAPIQQQVDEIVAQVENSKNELRKSIEEWVTEVDALLIEYWVCQKNAQDAFGQVLDNMRAADEKYGQIEKKMAAIKDAVAVKVD